MQSTKVSPAKKNATVEKEAETELLEKKHDILVQVYNVQELHDEYEREKAKTRKNTIHTDQTGKFPHVSSRGHKY